jgi:hypothetical protein
LRKYRFMRVESEFQSLLEGLLPTESHPKLNPSTTRYLKKFVKHYRIGSLTEYLVSPIPISCLTLAIQQINSTLPISFDPTDPILPPLPQSVDLHLQPFQKELDALDFARADVYLSFRDAEGNGNVLAKLIQGPARPPGLGKGDDSEGL